MENLIQNKILIEVLLRQRYSIAEKYFYIVLRYLHKKHKNDKGVFLGHDIATQNGILSFSSFGLSKRLCKNARKKLKNDGLIIFRHIYGKRGYRIGTEYALCEVMSQERSKEIHTLIFDRKPIELSTPDNFPHELRVISP